jgi:hypothetical protein
MRALPAQRRSGRSSLEREGSGVSKRTPNPRDDHLQPFASAGIIQFGIFCCAVTMVIVLAVAIAAS